MVAAKDTGSRMSFIGLVNGDVIALRGGLIDGDVIVLLGGLIDGDVIVLL